ncbi:MAG: RNA repair transcriptional activator RtcR family protein [Methylococcales bacterium]
MNRTVVSILGARLDLQGLGKRRWKRWRPNISILLHDDLVVDKFVLIHHSDETELADITINDIQHISPQTQVITYVVNYDNPWDFEQVYSQLLDFAKIYLITHKLPPILKVCLA